MKAIINKTIKGSKPSYRFRQYFLCWFCVIFLYHFPYRNLIWTYLKPKVNLQTRRKGNVLELFFQTLLEYVFQCLSIFILRTTFSLFPYMPWHPCHQLDSLRLLPVGEAEAGAPLNAKAVFQAPFHSLIRKKLLLTSLAALLVRKCIQLSINGWLNAMYARMIVTHLFTSPSLKRFSYAVKMHSCIIEFFFVEKSQWNTQSRHKNKGLASFGSTY